MDTDLRSLLNREGNIIKHFQKKLIDLEFYQKLRGISY